MIELSNCPVCHSSQLTPGYSGKTYRIPTDPQVWQISVCGECTHSFMNPQPAWDELAKYYSSDYDPYQPSHGNEHENDEKAVKTALGKGSFRHIPIPENKKLLDVGCGGGFFLRIAKKLGAEVQGVEPSEFGAKQACQSGLDVFHGTLDKFVELQNANLPQYDIITSNHVLEHMPDPVLTLKLMKKLLNSEGYIWISVPNADCDFAKQLQWRWHSTDLPYHLMQFTPDSLSKAAELAGLKIKRLYTYTLPDAAKASLSSLYRNSFFVPQRLSNILISQKIANSLALNMDKKKKGEAIIIELKN